MLSKSIFAAGFLASMFLADGASAADCDFVSLEITVMRGKSLVQNAVLNTSCKAVTPMASLQLHEHEVDTFNPVQQVSTKVEVGEAFNVVPYDPDSLLLSYSVSFIKNPEKQASGGASFGTLPNGLRWPRAARYADDVVIPISGTTKVRFKLAGDLYKLTIKSRPHTIASDSQEQ